MESGTEPYKLLTVAAVAEHWQCSARFVQKLIASGALPAIHFGPKLVRIRPEAVDAYEAKLSSDWPDRHQRPR